MKKRYYILFAVLVLTAGIIIKYAFASQTITVGNASGTTITKNYSVGNTIYAGLQPEQGGGGGLTQLVYLSMDTSTYSNPTIFDQTANGNNATKIGLQTFVAGKVNEAIFCDGWEDWIEIPSSTTMDVLNAGDWSVALWEQETATDHAYMQTILSQTDAGGTGRNIIGIDTWNYALGCGSAGFYTKIGGTVNCMGTSSIKDAWTHIVLTVHENGANDELSFYFNGALTTSTVANSETNFGTWIICDNKTHDYTQFYKGNIDEFKIYNSALTAQEVADLYNSY